MEGSVAELRERPDVAFFARIDQIERLAAQRLERALADGLSTASLAVLERLAASASPPTPRELAAALRLSKPAMTHTLQRLEAVGFVAIAPDAADKRMKRVAITPAGVAARRMALDAVRPRIEAVRQAFDAAEFARALPFLERLASWLATNP
jgi:DNA-binding MarR family transcriptional regulator